MWPSFSLHSFYRAGPVSRLHFHHLIADPLRLTTAFLSKKNWHHYWSHTFHFPLSVPLTKMMVVFEQIGSIWTLVIAGSVDFRKGETSKPIWICCEIYALIAISSVILPIIGSSLTWQAVSSDSSFQKWEHFIIESFYMYSKNDWDVKKSDMKAVISIKL